MSHVLKNSKLKSLKVTKQDRSNIVHKLQENNLSILRTFGNQLELLEFQHIRIFPENVSDMVKISTLKELNIYNYGETFTKENIIISLVIMVLLS